MCMFTPTAEMPTCYERFQGKRKALVYPYRDNP